MHGTLVFIIYSRNKTLLFRFLHWCFHRKMMWIGVRCFVELCQPIIGTYTLRVYSHTSSWSLKHCRFDDVQSSFNVLWRIVYIYAIQINDKWCCSNNALKTIYSTIKANIVSLITTNKFATMKEFAMCSLERVL